MSTKTAARPATRKSKSTTRSRPKPAIVAAPTLGSCIAQARGYVSTLEDCDDAAFVLTHALSGIDASLLSIAGAKIDVGAYLKAIPPEAGASKPRQLLYALEILRLGHAIGLAGTSTMIATINRLAREELERRGLACA